MVNNKREIFLHNMLMLLQAQGFNLRIVCVTLFCALAGQVSDFKSIQRRASCFIVFEKWAKQSYMTSLRKKWSTTTRGRCFTYAHAAASTGFQPQGKRCLHRAITCLLTIVHNKMMCYVSIRVFKTNMSISKTNT